MPSNLQIEHMAQRNTSHRWQMLLNGNRAATSSSSRPRPLTKVHQLLRTKWNCGLWHCLKKPLQQQTNKTCKDESSTFSRSVNSISRGSRYVSGAGGFTCIRPSAVYSTQLSNLLTGIYLRHLSGDLRHTEQNRHTYRSLSEVLQISLHARAGRSPLDSHVGLEATERGFEKGSCYPAHSNDEAQRRERGTACRAAGLTSS